jgi:hypothetical protein
MQTIWICKHMPYFFCSEAVAGRTVYLRPKAEETTLQDMVKKWCSFGLEGFFMHPAFLSSVEDLRKKREQQ